MTEKMDKKDCPKSYVDDELQATVAFLSWLADKMIGSTRNVDAQANIVVGLSAGIFILAINELASTDKFHFTLIVVSIFSALSAIIALCAIRPLEFLMRKGHEESMFFSRTISGFSTAKEYSKELVKIFKSDDEIFHQYGIEIYNLAKYYYRPKRNLYAYSRNIFLLGSIVSIVSVLVEFILLS
jgi:hypothetical protein